MDLFWPGVLMVKQEPGQEPRGRARPGRAVLPVHKTPSGPATCDFGNFALFDLASRAMHEFTLEQLPGQLGLFGLVADTGGAGSPEHPISTKASRFMSEMCLGLKRSGYGGRDAGREKALELFREKTSGLKFLDPACSSGNFLITAYKHMRRLELEAMV